MSASHSEVARLREQIELECQSLERLMRDPAIVASHRTITHKYQSLGLRMTELGKLVGEEKATEIVAYTYVEILG